MLPTAKIKTESGPPSNSFLCSTCLSLNRKLRCLGDYSEIFRMICSNSAWLGAKDIETKIFICWECQALLHKVKNFQLQADKAQKILSSYSNNNSVKSLSNLLIKETAIEDYITQDGNQIFQEPKEESKIVTDLKTDDTEPPALVKQEETDYIENEDDFLANYEFLAEEIKDETLEDAVLKNLKEITVTKSKPKKKTKKIKARVKNYKLTRINAEKFVTRLPFQINELNDWIERERNSTYYRNLYSKCDKCVSTIRCDTLEQHNKKVHTKTKINKYECEICHQYFSTKHSLGTHYNQHFYYYYCTQCGYKCYKRHNYYNHAKLHEKVVQCLECEGTFRTTREFFKHWTTLHTRFQCDYCNKFFKTKLKIEKHIYRIHTDLRCEACNFSFVNYRSFYEHNKLKHTVERNETTYCVQCDIQFDNSRLFGRHVRTAIAHTKERDYTRPKVEVKCPECPNVYARKTYMMNHYRMVHANQSKYHCDICQKLFLNRTRYKDHMMYKHEGHQRQRTHMCFVCGRGFFTKRILTNHLRTHTGERPFECPHCDSKFGQKVALQSHVRFIHLKAKRKPYLVPAKNSTAPSIPPWLTQKQPSQSLT